MSQVLSVAKQQALQTARESFKTANLHPATLEWRRLCRYNQGYYDGSGQWSVEDLAVLASRGQEPITVNMIQGFIDALCGVETQSRYRVAVRSDSGRPEDERLAQALTHYLFHLQEHNSIPHYGSLKFKDALISGIGWSDLYKDPETGTYHYDYVDPFNVLPDPDDLSPQYTNMKYVCRKRWMRPEMVAKTWPQVTSLIDLTNPQIIEGLYSEEIMDRSSDYTALDTYTSCQQSRLLVVEVQYKVAKKAYRGLDQQGHAFETFDEDQAQAIAESPQSLEEIPSQQIMRTLFLDTILLEHAPLSPNLPNPQDFSCIPYVWKRRFKTGVPYGLLESIKDLQRDANIRITKSLYLMNSSRVIIQGNIDPGESTEAFRAELKRPDSVIILPEEAKIQISSNAELAEPQLQIVELYLDFMKRVTGIHDEMLGIQTNATSAVAQNVRQVNSVRNNVFAFDNFSEMKKREAKFLLKLIQTSNDQNLAVQILTEQEREWLVLNLAIEKDGKLILANTINHLPVTLYVEEVPDFKSTFEEQRAMLQSLLGNANANWLMLSPKLLQMLGIRDGEKIAQEMSQVMQNKQRLESQALDQGRVGGLPPDLGTGGP